MKANVGKLDRTIRIIAALILLAVYFFTDIIPGKFELVLPLIAAVLLITGFVKFCPLYTVCKIRTNKD